MISLVDSLEFDSTVMYDLFVYAVGYERRSSHLVRRGIVSAETWALPFRDFQVLSFDDNLRLARERGCLMINVPDKSLDEELSRRLSEALQAATGRTGGMFRVAFDVSSLTRSRLSSVVGAAFEAARSVPGSQPQFDFFYSPAAFSSAPEPETGALKMAPISARYRGALRGGALPILAVFGLGFEPRQAIGAYEMLEPSDSFAFRPTGGDPRFIDAVDAANLPLTQLVGQDRTLDYSIVRPHEIYAKLESMCFAHSADSRVVLLPMGPKIFALICLLVSESESEMKPSVWRVGQASYSDPSEIVESGQVLGLRINPH